MVEHERLVVVSFAVEPQQAARLAAVAARERRSMSFIARDALEAELLRYERQHHETAREAAR